MAMLNRVPVTMEYRPQVAIGWITQDTDKGDPACWYWEHVKSGLDGYACSTDGAAREIQRLQGLWNQGRSLDLREELRAALAKARVTP